VQARRQAPADWNEWLKDTLASFARDGTRVETVDLRKWHNDPTGVRDTLAGHDLIWVCGGNGFYLRCCATAAPTSPFASSSIVEPSALRLSVRSPRESDALN